MFLKIVSSLTNPNLYTGFGRNINWDGPGITNGVVPNPTDNLDYLTQYEDTLLFGKKVTSSNIRRVIKRVDWDAVFSAGLIRV